MTTSTRAFLALELPAEAARLAAGVLSARASATGGSEVKWVRPENLHITLRFFGNLDPARLEAASAFVRGLDGQFAPIATAWAGLGAFPSERRVQVIWLGLADADRRLKALAREVNQGLVRGGFGRADKPFKAHITIGRVRRGRRVSWEQVSERLTIPDGAFSIATIALIKSTLTPQGPVYTPLATACARPMGPQNQRD